GAWFWYRAAYNARGSSRVVPQGRPPGWSVHADTLRMFADRISPKPPPRPRPLRVGGWPASYQYKIARPAKWLCREHPQVHVARLPARSGRFRAGACAPRLRIRTKSKPAPPHRLAAGSTSKEASGLPGQFGHARKPRRPRPEAKAWANKP